VRTSSGVEIAYPNPCGLSLPKSTGHNPVYVVEPHERNFHAAGYLEKKMYKSLRTTADVTNDQPGCDAKMDVARWAGGCSELPGSLGELTYKENRRAPGCQDDVECMRR
jgi:hypothetical protein